MESKSTMGKEDAFESRALSRKGKWQRSGLGFIPGSSTATEAGENCQEADTLVVSFHPPKSRRISIFNFPPAILGPNLG